MTDSWLLCQGGCSRTALLTLSVSKHTQTVQQAESVLGGGELKTVVPLLSLLSEFSLSAH